VSGWEWAAVAIGFAVYVIVERRRRARLARLAALAVALEGAARAIDNWLDAVRPKTCDFPFGEQCGRCGAAANEFCNQQFSGWSSVDHGSWPPGRDNSGL
jgi:hypothetical protein